MEKVYIATALTQSSDEHKKEIAELRDKIKNYFEVLDFFGLGPGIAKEVYEYDQKLIQQCDFLLAECSEQSLGTGYEIAYALSIGKYVLAFAKENATVGRMIQGITDPNFKYQTYKSIDEVIEKVRTYVRT